MPGSLDSLFKRIQSNCRFKIMNQSSLLSKTSDTGRIPRYNYEERLECMKQKGVFPYSWAQSLEYYDLPYLVEKRHFFNTLTQSDISEEDYCFAKKVWKTFDMKQMKDYCKMYCLTGKTNLVSSIIAIFFYLN